MTEREPHPQEQMIPRWIPYRDIDKVSKDITSDNLRTMESDQIVEIDDEKKGAWLLGRLVSERLFTNESGTRTVTIYEVPLIKAALIDGLSVPRQTYDHVKDAGGEGLHEPADLDVIDEARSRGVSLSILIPMALLKEASNLMD